MSAVVLRHITKSYGDVPAVRGLDLSIREGEFLTLLGPSGCGKTTTLRIIAGFVVPMSGEVFIGGDDVTAVPPNKRGIGMVFQDYALFPHMSIGENIAFGLKERKVDKATLNGRVKELLELVRLGNLGDRYPSELSGGQKQRIAVARAVAYSPRVLLMDEPLGALDLKLREAMQSEIRQIQRRLGMTTVYVTHDQTEAMHMSDRIVVMKDGVIEQMGTSEEIYNQPASRFVAHFIGQINLLNGTVEARDGNFAIIDVNGTKHRTRSMSAVKGTATLGLRPQHLRLLNGREATSELNTMPGRIRTRTFSGNLVHVGVELDDGQAVTVEVDPDTVVGDAGTQVRVGWLPERGTLLVR